MAKRDFYTTQASELKMTAKKLVKHRIANLLRMLEAGKRIQDTVMTRAFVSAVLK